MSYAWIQLRFKFRKQVCICPLVLSTRPLQIFSGKEDKECNISEHKNIYSLTLICAIDEIREKERALVLNPEAEEILDVLLLYKNTISEFTEHMSTLYCSMKSFYDFPDIYETMVASPRENEVAQSLLKSVMKGSQ